jgi:ferrochelatase
LEEIDVEYKELALQSGIKHWGRVPALGCEPTFISDLADAVIESLPYVGAMAVSNLEARQVTSITEHAKYSICIFMSYTTSVPEYKTFW